MFLLNFLCHFKKENKSKNKKERGGGGGGFGMSKHNRGSHYLYRTGVLISP